MKIRIGKLITTAILLIAGVAMAEEDGKTAVQTAPMHGKKGHMMAAMQECIKSGKSMPDCRQEMMKQHKSGMGPDTCPMMQNHAEHDISDQEG